MNTSRSDSNAGELWAAVADAQARIYATEETQEKEDAEMLIQHGAAPYAVDPENQQSCFVRTVDIAGADKIYWGLRAEIASLIIGSEIGIGYDPSQHAAYVANWITVLEEDPLEIFPAAADAEKIQKYLCSRQQQQSIPDGISLAVAIKEYERRVDDGPESRKLLEKENPALVAARDRAVSALRKEQLQKELAANSQPLPLRF